jgi:hypothetical protein
LNSTAFQARAAGSGTPNVLLWPPFRALGDF